MSAPTVSAYPQPVDELLPVARTLAVRLGAIPSRNRLMRELKVGAPKADAVRDALERAEFASPVAPAPAPPVEEQADPVADPVAGPTPAETQPPDRVGLEAALVELMQALKAAAPKADAVGDALTRGEFAPPVTPAPAPPVDELPDPVADPVAGPTPAETVPDLAPAKTVVEPVVLVPVGVDGHPGTNIIPGPVTAAAAARRPVRSWPVLLLALPAFVAIWSGWVGLGGLTGFGVVHPLPGIWDGLELNTAITLPVGVETYAAFALRVWLAGGVADTARRFAKWSAIGSLILGAAGQVAYHLMAAAQYTHAPTAITTLVSCLPVAVLGMGAALAHLIRNPDTD
jgi:hypothetical protein